MKGLNDCDMIGNVATTASFLVVVVNKRPINFREMRWCHHFVLCVVCRTLATNVINCSALRLQCAK